MSAHRSVAQNPLTRPTLLEIAMFQQSASTNSQPSNGINLSFPLSDASLLIFSASKYSRSLQRHQLRPGRQPGWDSRNVAASNARFRITSPPTGLKFAALRRLCNRGTLDLNKTCGNSAPKKRRLLLKSGLNTQNARRSSTRIQLCHARSEWRFCDTFPPFRRRRHTQTRRELFK